MNQPSRALVACACLPLSLAGCASPPQPHIEPGYVINSPPATNGQHAAALRDEILAMRDEDQRLRRALQAVNFSDPALIEQVSAADHRNTVRMKEIVDRHGWPTRSLVGDAAAEAAWLLVQHADHDREFQRRCLVLMEQLDRHEVFPANVAYLTDRILVGEGKPQRYGTQFHTVDGKLQPRPVENPDRLDERRRSMGLTTMAEYIELMHT